jgi:hypothetical protein
MPQTVAFQNCLEARHQVEKSATRNRRKKVCRKPGGDKVKQVPHIGINSPASLVGMLQLAGRDF